MPSEHQEPVQQQLLWSGIQRQRSAAQRMSLDAGMGAVGQQSTAGAGDVPHKQHRSFNTARHAPSLDTTVASAAVTRSLGVQYKLSSTGSSTAAAAAAAEQQGSLRGTAAGGRHSLEGPKQCRDVDAASDQNKDEVRRLIDCLYTTSQWQLKCAVRCIASVLSCRMCSVLLQLQPDGATCMQCNKRKSCLVVETGHLCVCVWTGTVC